MIYVQEQLVFTKRHENVRTCFKYATAHLYFNGFLQVHVQNRSHIKRFSIPVHRSGIIQSRSFNKAAPLYRSNPQSPT